MTENDFFCHLRQLSVAQLSEFHKHVLEKIQDIQAHRKAALKADEKAEKANALAAQSQPKVPSNHLNLDAMADNLDLDLSAIMREIAKR